MVNGYYNYLLTPAKPFLPALPGPSGKSVVLDGASPNLNKFLSVGNFKNVVVAAALAKLLALDGPVTPVALLGAAKGVLPGALDALQGLYALAGYSPTVYLDTDFTDVVKALPFLQDGTGDYVGTKVFLSKAGPMVAVKSDGSPTYAGYDLAFAQVVKPDYYLVGAEQAGYFASMGLPGQYLKLGLVLAASGKKMGSMSGDKLLAVDALNLLVDSLDPTPDPLALAYNVLALPMLMTASTTSKFDVAALTKSSSPGLYVSYTLAKVGSALTKAGVPDDLTAGPDDLTSADVALLGAASYADYYTYLAVTSKSPMPLANYLPVLAKALATAYSAGSVVNGAPGYQYAMLKGYQALKAGMLNLSLKPLAKV